MSEQLDRIEGKLDALLQALTDVQEGDGCDHEWLEITTSGNPHRRFVCPYCGQTKVEEWN